MESVTDEQVLDESVNLAEEDDISSETVDELMEATEEVAPKPVKSRKKTKQTI